jgi:hypothetical protein
MLLDDRYATKGSSPYAGCFDEKCTQNTTNSACEDEGDEFKELPVQMVTDFEEDNFLSAIRI